MAFTWSSMGTGSDFVFKFTNSLHRGIFKASKGRVMGKFFGMPVVMLTTTGRKTGQKRTSMLTSPTKDANGNVVLVASKGGDPKHPRWFLNLRSNPVVEATFEGTKHTMHARVATPEERESLWPKVVAGYKGYGDYQKKTDRVIPLVILEPA